LQLKNNVVYLECENRGFRTVKSDFLLLKFMKKINIKDNRVIVFVGLLLASFVVFGFVRADDNRLNYFQDRDQDGLSDEEERALGTDWQKADTDGDGYTDGVEVASGYNPLIPAPGDKIGEEERKKVEKNIQVAGVRKERKNLTKEFINKLKARKGDVIETFREVDKENGLITKVDDIRKLKQVSLTEEDIRELAEETVEDVDLEEELANLDVGELHILPKVTAKSDRKKKAKIKKEIEEYLAQTGYIMAESLPFSVNSEDEFADKLDDFMTGIGEDIVIGSELETRRSKSKLAKAVENLKKVQIPYVLADIHTKTVKLLQYLVNQDEEVVFKKDDPIAMSVMIGQLQAVMGEMQDIQRELDIVLDKYGVGVAGQSEENGDSEQGTGNW